MQEAKTIREKKDQTTSSSHFSALLFSPFSIEREQLHLIPLFLHFENRKRILLIRRGETHQKFHLKTELISTRDRSHISNMTQEKNC